RFSCSGMDEKMAAIGKEVRKALTARTRVDLRIRAGRTALSGDREDTAGAVGNVENGSVRVPVAAGRCQHVGERPRRPALHLDAAQLVAGEKGDRACIG